MIRFDGAKNGADAAAQTTPNERRPKPADHDFSLVIPAFNEANRLPWTLAELRRFLDASGIDYRVADPFSAGVGTVSFEGSTSSGGGGSGGSASTPSSGSSAGHCGLGMGASALLLAAANLVRRRRG